MQNLDFIYKSHDDHVSRKTTRSNYCHDAVSNNVLCTSTILYYILYTSTLLVVRIHIRKTYCMVPGDYVVSFLQRLLIVDIYCLVGCVPFNFKSNFVVTSKT